MISTNVMLALRLAYSEPLAIHHYQYPLKPILRKIFLLLLRFIWNRSIFVWKRTLTSTYETGKIPFWLATRPSNQLSSTRRVNTTSSPLCNDSSIADCAWKLNLARAWPSDGFLVGNRTPSFDIIYFFFKWKYSIWTINNCLLNIFQSYFF